MPRLIFPLLIVFLITPGAEAADPPMTWILVPVYYAHDGAYGSEWNTDFAVMNTGVNDARYLFTPSHSFPEAGLNRFGAGVAVRLNAPGYGFPTYGPVGVLFWVEEERSADFRFSLRVRDRSRQAEGAGTAIPVAREEDFAQRVDLLDISTDERFRHSLRIYGDSRHRSAVRVRVFHFPRRREEPPRSSAMADFELVLEPPGRLDPPIWPAPPQTILNNFFSVMPELRAVESVRLQIESLDPAQRIWAFVTTNNNVTQEVTVTAP